MRDPGNEVASGLNSAISHLQCRSSRKFVILLVASAAPFVSGLETLFLLFVLLSSQRVSSLAHFISH